MTANLSGASAQAVAAARANLTMIAAARARTQPTGLAYTFLADGDTEAGSFTYAQLDAAAREIAAGLLESVRSGDRAVLIYETGLDFISAFYGCLYAGIVAVPIPAPEASRLLGAPRRIKAVLEDCGARVLLGNQRTHELLRTCHLESTLANVHWIDTARFAGGKRVEALAPCDPRSVAYLQYTSGSTTTPKGVMVTHANIVGHLAQMQTALDYNSSSVSVCWLPHFHDYALIEGFLLPLFNGTPAYFMTPFAFLKRPGCWLKAIAKYRGTHSQGPNFAYRYCVRRVTEPERAELDLKSWRSAGNGAEPIHPSTSDDFYAAFAACGLKREALRPAYGLAEATLMVTTTDMAEPPFVGRFNASALTRGEAVVVDGGPDLRSVAACGKPLPGTSVVIVDPNTRRRLGEDRVGEVWVHSVGVAAGYWGRAAEAGETFQATIAGEDSQPYLRTGDLGFLHRGQLHITARAKDLIIIRGTNYGPQDIEWTAQHAHAALRSDHGAAFSVDVEGEERLCLVQEVERGQYSDEEFAQIYTTVSRSIADEHLIPVHALVLIKRGSLPKTSSGKVQRQTCRHMYLEGLLKIVKAWSAESVRMTAKAAHTTTSQDDRGDSPKVDDLLHWLRGYAETRINSRLIDERRCVPPHIILDLGNRGLFGLQAPAAYGGLELSHRETMRVYQQLAAIDLTLAIFLFLHNTNGLLPILDFAPAELRDELMPILARGREVAAFALSEPEAGSNLGGVQSRAVPTGRQSWLLHGVKRWNGSAWAGVISVFAREVGADRKLRGLTGFVVRQSEPGLRLGAESLTMGVRGIMQNSLHLDGVEISRDRLLGEVGDGLKIAERVLSHGRIATACIALGAMQRCAQLMFRYASRRPIDTGLLLHNPQTALKMSELVHRIALTEEALRYTIGRMDQGEPIVPDIAMFLKTTATDSLNFAADLLMQTLGGRGYMENNLAPQIFRDARLLSIGEGANEGLIAALGRSLRLSDIVPTYLRADASAANVLTQLAQSKQLVQAATPPAALNADAVQPWRDFVMGRFANEALNLATAERLSARGGTEATLAWAKARFERLTRKTIENGMIGSDLIQNTIGSYRSSIGDLEPLAAGVDYELDPLLRRDVKEVAPSAEDLQQLSGEQKREKLRELLRSKKS